MTSVGVIGGGIVGSAVAAWLRSEGYRVTIFERAPEAQSASSGGAGLIAPAATTPFATSTSGFSAPLRLSGRRGSMSVRARDLPALAPWLFNFARAARRRCVEHSIASLAQLMMTALADHHELARRGGLSGHMGKTGALHVYGSRTSLHAAMAELRERRNLGLEIEEVSPENVRHLVPALAGPFAGALLTPDCWTVSSPDAILRTLRRNAAGGSLAPREVIALHRDPGCVSVVTADGGDLPFDHVVVAGGVWSGDLVHALGLSVPVAAVRGYSTTFPRATLELPLPVCFPENGIVATPLADGLRVGGAAELAAVDAPPDFRRAAVARQKARRFLPDLAENGGVEWMGCRPSTPDALPVIGRDPHDARIVYAFGHGDLGLTLAAATARHVAGLVAGRRDPLLEPFGIERFQ